MDVAPVPIGGGCFRILNGETIRGKVRAETIHNQLISETIRDGMMRRIPRSTRCRHELIRRIRNKKVFINAKENRVTSPKARGSHLVRIKTLDECCRCENIMEFTH